MPGVWGRTTVLKVVGGEVRIRAYGTTPDVFAMRVAEFGRRAGDMTRPFDAMRTTWFRTTAERFDRQGPGWPPLRPSTLRSRRFPGRPMLRQTDALFESVTGGANTVWQARPRSLRYGSRLPRFFWHQYGTSRMPARTMIVYTQGIRAELRQRTLRWIHIGRP